MSTWAGVDFGPVSLCETQNYLNTWYFKRSERKAEPTGDPDFPTRYVYRASRDTIARRLELDGYDLSTLEQDFRVSINRKIEACRQSIRDGFDPDENNSKLLPALEASSLQDWIDRLTRIITEKLESAGFDRSKDHGDPILNYMLAGYHDFYFEDAYSAAGYSFPCSSEEMYAVVLMKILPNEPDFVLDATAMIQSGWTDNFEDFIEHHSDHTTFYKTFKTSLERTLALGSLGPDNSDLAKLLYANVITVLETYLSDTITKQVLKREAILRRFVLTHPPFAQDKFKKSEVFKAYEGIREEARKALSSTSFHDIVTAKRLFKEVLATSFPDDMGELMKAVNKRHDIVHRNGKTQHNIELVVTMDDVKHVAELANAAMLHIDAQIKDAILERDDEA